jgi:predicted ArsR family transcriptional regulator
MRAREAGRRWADRLDPTETRTSKRTRVNALVAHLDRLGFAPRRSRGRTSSTRIEMWSCPYLEVARERPEVTCGVHRGLVEGLLARDGLDTDIELVPFATADYCTVTVLATAPPRKAHT